MTGLPGTPGARRRLALIFLALAVFAVVKTIDADLPRDQALVFRLGDGLRGAPLRLTATITRAGEGEARSGFTLTRSGDERSDPRQAFRAPNGDYLVTVDIETVQRGSAPPAEGQDRVPTEKRETSSVHRVTLEGGDIVVPIGPRVSE